MPVPRTSLPPVLLVDDSIDDVYIMSRLIQRAGIRNPIQIARDGEEAIRSLARMAEGTAETQVPLMILTDLNMPRRDGFDLLAWLRDRSEFGSVLTIVLSSSDREEDVERAFALGCEGYLTKYPRVEEVAAVFAAADTFSGGGAISPLPGLKPARR